MKSPMRTLNIFFMCLLVLGIPTSVWAQDSMEGIIAIVGREIVLKSDVDGQMEMLAQRDPRVDRKDVKLRQAILDQLINERLIMTKAIEDSIEVTDEEITQRMEYQIQTLIQQFGSEKRIEDMYGMSMMRIRREFRDEIRKRLLVEKMQQKQFGQVKASRADVEAFYAKYRDSLPKVPERVDLFHIVKYVKASDEKNKEAYTLAMRIRDSIVKGGSFSDFARRYSGDPISASNGGDLGTVDRGKFVPAFETAAFNLSPDEISQPVETPFGWHVIQLISKTATSMTARHILIRVGQSDEDRERVKTELVALKQRVEKGENFETLAREFSDEKETQGFGGSMGQIELARLPEEMQTSLNAMKDGAVSDPSPYAADPTKPGFHILYRKRIIPAHTPSVDEDYKQLEQMASFEKKQRLEQEWVQKLRKELYWETR
ncbi:MAG: peptidylprolyl isomerase [Ignavibacteria bacterium]|nr:peptidylprolyl isomerase [Ignavibacteria bacterium]MBP7094399.1 peptidylprolyl isomerase [Candidatus Kapabacteria bacterium]MBK6419213.1 peptidylprolyl isomerase [Ignavibacteria bacterium]MBK6760096.1 peptidylprolyl isomerase [Ignavibacteria bacterium]MBK7185923.1 peptidylprolyl isomerase [Ignavibacteria bacterium]